MAGNLGIDHLGPECLEPAEHPLLVGFDQGRIAATSGASRRSTRSA
jgi:hypothetical protein